MNIEDLDSDVSDEDYVPEGQNVELPSEEDSDGDVEDDLIPDQSKKRGKGSNKSVKKSKKLRTEEVVESDNDEESLVQTKPVTPEDEKKKADSLWADFLKDTGSKPKSIDKGKVVENKSVTSTAVRFEKKIDKLVEEKKVKVTKIFEFAGEEVRVEQEVPVNSLEAKLSTGSGGIATRGSGRAVRGRGGGGSGSGSTGLSSVLSQLGKKQKISTLEKTKLDWDKFKKEENIEEELQSFNKGKHGYLERQDFLERADLRQFEIEKEIRATHRSQRL